MNQFVRRLGFAACAISLSLGGCSAAGTPHPGTGVTTPLGTRAAVMIHPDSPLRNFSVPNHVITWDWYDHTGEVNPTQAAPYLDYAAVQVNDANAFAAAGIKTVFYTDPNRSHVGTPMYTNDESTFAHDCNGVRITVGHRPVTTYQMDPRSPDLEPLWGAWVASVLGNGYNFNYVFEDGANNIHNTSAVPCGYTLPSWTAASNANDTLLGPSLIIYNGLGTLGDGYGQPPPSILLNPTAYGGMMEDCYGKDSVTNPLPKTTVWLNYETTEGTMAAIQKFFVCRGLSSFPAKSSLTRRIYQYASYLLTYDPGSSAISEKYTTPSNLAVFPEEGLVALDPIIPSPAKIGKLKTSHWTYGRQYASCYLWGTLVGACAAVVNADVPTITHPFPWPGVYTHTLVLSGGGVLDGGTASVSGPAPPTDVPGTSALIAFP
jgi:hypothetical protein